LPEKTADIRLLCSWKNITNPAIEASSKPFADSIVAIRTAIGTWRFFDSLKSQIVISKGEDIEMS
jgi:hypothetical protein